MGKASEFGNCAEGTFTIARLSGNFIKIGNKSALLTNTLITRVMWRENA